MMWLRCFTHAARKLPPRSQNCLRQTDDTKCDALPSSSPPSLSIVKLPGSFSSRLVSQPQTRQFTSTTAVQSASKPVQADVQSDDVQLSDSCVKVSCQRRFCTGELCTNAQPIMVIAHTKLSTSKRSSIVLWGGSTCLRRRRQGDSNGPLYCQLCGLVSNAALSCLESQTQIFARSQQILKLQERNSFLRVMVEGGGCSGFQYIFQLDHLVNDDDKYVHTSHTV